MEKKLKEIYNSQKLKGSDPLVKWYNEVIEKTPEELTISDVARCIRQDLFIDDAYIILLAYLLHNPNSGDLFDGELLDKASAVDKRLISKHQKMIEEILDKAKAFYQTNDWDDIEERDDYYSSIMKLENKIKE